MFSLATGLYNSYFTSNSISLLIIGCDGVGKTALLERCKITKFTERRFTPSSIMASCRAVKSGRSSSRSSNTRPKHLSQQQRRHYALPETLNMEKIRPTVGQNIAKIDLFGTKSVLWDLGGQAQMRPLWERYYNDCNVLIFVVEAAMFYKSVEDERLLETKEELNKILQEEGLLDIPILIFVNKVDEVLIQHQQYESHEEEELDEFWEDELYQCVMQRLELRSAITSSGSYSLSADENKTAVDGGNRNSVDFSDEEGSTNAHGRLPRRSRIGVFVGSAKTGQGVRFAMEWLVHTAHASSSQSKRLAL